MLDLDKIFPGGDVLDDEATTRAVKEIGPAPRPPKEFAGDSNYRYVNGERIHVSQLSHHVGHVGEICAAVVFEQSYVGEESEAISRIDFVSTGTSDSAMPQHANRSSAQI